MCDHHQILNDIKTVIAADTTVNIVNETADYVKKVTICSFVTFLHYFCLADPYKHTKDLNEALSYDIAHMEAIKTLLVKKSQSELMYCLGNALNIDPEIICPWIGTEWTPQMTVASYCASVVSIKHVNPLIVTVMKAPEMFYEYICVYNRIWRMGKMAPERDMCCDNSRLLYSVRMFATTHEEIATPNDLVIKLRLLLDLPATTTRSLRASSVFIDYVDIFKTMKIRELR